MVEAGANQVSEEKLLEALDLAHEEIKKLCEAQLDLQRQAGKAKWLDASVTEEVEQRVRGRDPRADQRRGSARGRRRHRGGTWRQLSMDSTEEDVLRQVQRKMSLATVLEQIRLEAVLQPVREQFESDLRALTDAEQDSKELKSAKRQLLFDRIIDTVELPFPVGPSVGEGEAATRRTR